MSNLIYGLLGANRVGKNTVGSFLKENCGFLHLAFADQIKLEYGISKEKFEDAKNLNNINHLREDLWNFSRRIKEKNPLYFINKVMDVVAKSKNPVVISDIRTVDELKAVLEYSPSNRIYLVVDIAKNNFDGEFIVGSKINRDDLNSLRKVDNLTYVVNDSGSNLDMFFKYLSGIFSASLS